MLAGAAISFFTYKLVVSLISRFIRPEDADIMGLEAKSVSVRFREGEILDESSVREQIRESSGWQAVTVAPSRKTVNIGAHEFRAKSVGWRLSSEGRGTITGGNYEGFSKDSNSNPDIKLNLTTPWVFFVEKEALSDLENGASGTILYIRNSETSPEKRVDDLEDFFSDFSSFEPSVTSKRTSEQMKDLEDTDIDHLTQGEVQAGTKKNFIGKLFKKKQKNVAPTREPELPVSDETDW
jgi:hypothetical protein